ncbi:MAG: hypothetical protein ACI35Q_08320 [Marinilabiliaceae bacterium]
MAKSTLSSAVNSDNLKRIGCMLVGVGLGTFISRKLQDTAQTSGIDGISNLSNYLGPGAVALAGLMAHQSSKDSMLRDIALGASISGASQIVNNLIGKQVVSLNGDVDPMLPGVGDIPLLPSENYAATHYDDAQSAPAAQLVADTAEAASSDFDTVEGIGSDLDPVDLSGIEEAAIV